MKVNRCTSGKRGSERDLHLIVFVEFYYTTVLRRLLRGYKADFFVQNSTKQFCCTFTEILTLCLVYL